MLIKALAAAAGNFGGGYSIDNSLRFNDDDLAYLSRTPSVTSNRKTFTWSAWVKRGNLSTAQFNTLICSDSGADPDRFYFGRSSTNPDKLTLSLADTYSLITTQVFRDISGWYHIAVVVDTTQATSSNRVKLYVNGEQITTFSTASYPPLNYDTQFNWTSRSNFIGARTGGTDDFDGYMAEVNFIDGQALTPDDFGQIDEDTGEWSPKKYSGTYGTNGFYLEFKDGAALGDDTSGNTNDWTPTNLASTDQMLDTPTNNSSVLNSISSLGALSQGNLLLSTNATISWRTAVSTIGVSSGKWYFEACLRSTDSPSRPYSFIGVTTNEDSGSVANFLGATADSWGYYQRSGDIFTNGSGTPYTSISYIGNVIGVALDMDAGTLTFYINNVSQGVAVSGLTGTMFLGASVYTTSGTICAMDVNFGQDSSFAGVKTRQGNTDANGKGDFYYTPPTGYLALCTDNLAEPAIVDSETQFNVVTWNGNSADRNIDLGFEADFVWVKRKEIASQNCLFDRVRGNGLYLFSNLTNAEYNGVNDGIHFDYANGFNMDVGANVSYYNETGGSYVAWCWKAGGTAVTNNDGSITSQVSANVDAGFSIVGYTGTGSAVQIGHGLNSAPEITIIKRRDATTDWIVYTDVIDGSYDYLFLNTTAAKADTSVFSADADTFNFSSSSSVANTSGSSTIAYCFHSVESFSKFGTYVGNGSADGPFVYTGFRPAFVMVKRTDSTADWQIYDSERAVSNVITTTLAANLASAESAFTGGYDIDFVSNGFKPRSGPSNAINTSGGTYIYMAFAEAPLKNSLGR